MTPQTGINQSISVIGLGAMGQALAGALLEHGYRVTVWNRTASRADPLVARGALRAATPGEAVAAGGPVIVCLLDNDAVAQTLDGVEPADRTVINLTNGTPGQARALATWAGGLGARYLDGGIMATPPMIGTPGAFILYSGPQDILDAHRAPLEKLAAVRYAGADPGMAALQDVALLSAMYGLFSGMTHAFALTRSAGVPSREFAGMLGEWVTAMASLAPVFGEQLDSGDHLTGVTSSLAMQVAAYRNLIVTAEEQGVSPELITPLYRLMERAEADGAGNGDIMVTVDRLRTPVAPG
jgi:3-hydroxyisobutyrate dehydrogenase-like beta-hydroxyacid dehydrogenase